MQAASGKVLTAIQRMHGGVRDDATLIVADLMPADTTFPQLCQGAGMLRSLNGSVLGKSASAGSSSSSSSSKGGGCFCFGG